MNEQEFRDLRDEGLLNSNSCKQFHIDTCPHGVKLSNVPTDTSKCAECVVRENY